jgi:hypothetical protein
MFNAIIPLDPPLIAVQAEPEQLEGDKGAELLAKLEAFFMRPVALVAWDQESRFISRGAMCPEAALTDEDLQWRQFELPAEPEVPF